jgi:hypothetical protein
MVGAKSSGRVRRWESFQKRGEPAGAETRVAGGADGTT